MKQRIKIMFGLLLISLSLAAQTPDSLNKIMMHLQPDKYVDNINSQVTHLNGRLTTESAKYLKDVSGEESKLKAKLQKVDSNSAKAIFGDIQARYQAVESTFLKYSNGTLPPAARRYVPALDSVKNTLLFLQSNPGSLLNKVSDLKITAALGNVTALENKLQAASNLNSWLEQRRQYLTQQLGKFGMAGQVGALKTKVAYYKQQITDLKSSLQDPSKLQQKAMAILSQIPAYRSFLSRNSYLAKLFGQPDAYSLSDSGMQGLQTRAAVQKMIQEKTAVGGSGAQQQVGQQIGQATAVVGQLKSKISSGSIGNGDPQAVGSPLNSQKTKTLWQRLEYGANLQFEPSTTLLPTMADAALTLGYRLNDKSTIGVGVSYKMGLGDGLSHIEFASQGVGLRSYLDWKVKKNIYLSGGYEENYFSSFNTLDQLKIGSAWKESGLIGFSREYQVSKKVKGKVQLLWDFISYYQIPRTQPILFRVGWSL
jgi:hypothetical protein